MSVSRSEIEAIVRKVLATLTPEGMLSTDRTDQTVAHLGVAIDASKTLRLDDPVISLQVLNKRLVGIETLRIGPSAVVTPAARDLCVASKIRIDRGNASICTAPSIPQATASKSSLDTSGVPLQKPSQSLLIAGVPDWMSIVSGELCPKQTRVLSTSPDDTSVVREVAAALQGQQRVALAIVASPHAACWQASRNEALRCAVVAHWGQFDEILNEVPANVLFLSSRTWHASLVCNLARRWQLRLK